MADRGRPSKYTKALAQEICERLATGESLRAVCLSDHMPTDTTVRNWAINDTNGFSSQYARARDMGLDAMADEVLEISDDGQNDWMERNGKDDQGWALNGEHVQRSRLRVDTRKWILSKLAPKRYGDRIEQHHSGTIGFEQLYNDIDGATRGKLPDSSTDESDKKLH